MSFNLHMTSPDV